EDLPLYEDWECFARLARAGPVAFLDCETAWNHGHLDRRLTDADTLAQARARLTMIRRVWAADAAFLAAAGGEVRRTLRVEQRRQSRGKRDICERSVAMRTAMKVVALAAVIVGLGGALSLAEAQLADCRDYVTGIGTIPSATGDSFAAFALAVGYKSPKAPLRGLFT